MANMAKGFSPLSGLVQANSRSPGNRATELAGAEGRAKEFRHRIETQTAREPAAAGYLAPGVSTAPHELRTSTLVAGGNTVRGLRRSDPHAEHQLDQRPARHCESQDGAIARRTAEAF